jgi:hypothetical protein
MKKLLGAVGLVGIVDTTEGTTGSVEVALASLLPPRSVDGSSK